MLQTIDQFYTEAEPWVAQYDSWVARYHVEAISDHICYKCGSSEDFEAIRALFEDDSEFIYQSIVAGRRIAIIGLPSPIQTSLGQIHVLELSDQKPDGSQVSEFDHIELFPSTGGLAYLVEKLRESGVDLVKIERPHHTTWDTAIKGSFKARLEDGPLLDIIMKEIRKSG